MWSDIVWEVGRSVGDATQKLIAGIRLRIVIMCGDVQDIILPHGAEKVTLTLCDVAYDTWIETKKEKITRIFIRAPIPLSELRPSHGRQSFELTNIFRFVSAMEQIDLLEEEDID